MKFDLDRQIGPLAALVLVNLLLPVLGIPMREFGCVLFAPVAYLLHGIVPSSWIGDPWGRLFWLAVAQGILYSVILGIGCFRDCLGKVALWLLLAHAIASGICLFFYLMR